MMRRHPASILAFVILASTYGAGLWASSFCRGGRVLGRELREVPENSRRLESSLRESLVCKAFQGADENHELEDSIAFLQTKASVSKREDSSQPPKAPSPFKEPWAKYWEKCVDGAHSYNPGLVGPSKLSWGKMMSKQAAAAGGVKVGRYSSQFHTTERLWTLKNVIADPTNAKNEMPTSHSDAEMSELYSLTAERTHELDSKLAAMDSYLAKQGHHAPVQDVLASVHFADLENRMRSLLGKAQLSEQPEFVYNHWLKWLEKYSAEYSKRFGSFMNDGAFHAVCAKHQIEEFRELLMMGTGA